MLNLKNFFFIYTPHPQNKTDKLKNAFEKAGIKGILSPKEYKKGDVILYGKMRGAHDVYMKCKENKNNYLYIDNGYLKKDENGVEYYRISLNSEYLTKFKNYPKDRLEKFNIKFDDWNDNGEIILLIPPSPFRQLFEVENCVLWLKNTKERLSKISKKKIYVKEKFDGKNLSDLLNISYAVVCHSSTVGLDGLKIGKRVVCENEKYFLHDFVHKKIEDIDKKMNTRREFLFLNLSYNQFSLEEIASGDMEKIVNEFEIF